MKLDERDSLVLKGGAIGAITLHNFFHVLGPVRENEFDFDPARVGALLEWLGEPTHAVQGAFAYFGHLGVQLFIFISGYGLAARYFDAPPPFASLMRTRLRRLYPMFAVAVLLWVGCVLLFVGLAEGGQLIRDSALSVALTAAGVQNLMPGFDLPPVGPWWFLPFIVQVYALWPVLRALIVRFGAAMLVALSGGSLIATALLNPLLAPYSVNLLETPIGHLSELCLGIAAARYPVRLGRWLMPAAVPIFVGANFDERFWLLSFTSALVLMLALYEATRTLARRSRLLAVLGTLSMPLFLVNGLVRNVFVAIAEATGTWWGDLVLGFVAAAASVGLAALLSGLERHFRARRSPAACPARSTA